MYQSQNVAYYPGLNYAFTPVEIQELSVTYEFQVLIEATFLQSFERVQSTFEEVVEPRRYIPSGSFLENGSI